MNWQELKRSSIEDILGWAETQAWCQSMMDCDQDAQWHSEGDVWTHTKMVCEQLAKLDEWEALPTGERTVLIFAALLHDAAKPLTSQTDPETGRISSPKHAVKGEYLARGILRDLACDLATREEIVRLVRYHGRPAFLLERSEPTHEVVRLSWLVNNRLLYLLAVADTRGRDTDSMNRPEENLQYCNLLADENGCYDKPYSFAIDHALFVFFLLREPHFHYIPLEQYACAVT